MFTNIDSQFTDQFIFIITRKDTHVFRSFTEGPLIQLYGPQGPFLPIGASMNHRAYINAK